MGLESVLWIVIGLVMAWAALVAVLWLLRPKDIGLGELVGIVPDVLRLIRDLIRDGGTPLDVRVALVFLLLWLISPIDLVPEFIPVIGPFDDVVVAVVVLRYTRRRLGLEPLRQRWRGSDAAFALVVRVLG